MLTTAILENLAQRDTAEVVDILRSRQLVDTDAGDAVLGYLAGNHPDRYRAVIVALARGEKVAA